MTKPSVVARESQHTQLPKLEAGVFASRKYGVALLGCIALRDESGEVVALLPWADDAVIQGIVRACNAHTSLVEAAKLTILHFQRNQTSGNFQGDDEHEAWTALAQALRLAQGEK